MSDGVQTIKPGSFLHSVIPSGTAKANGNRTALGDDELRVALADCRNKPRVRSRLCQDVVLRAFGRRPSRAEKKMALALLDGRAIECPNAPSLDVAVCLAVLETALRGHRCHVLSMSDRAALMAERLAPALRLSGLSWARLSRGDTVRQRSTAYAKSVVFGTTRQVAMDIARTKVSHGRAQSPLRQLVSRLSAPIRSDAPPVRGTAFDTCLVLDAEISMCRRSLTSLVVSLGADDVLAGKMTPVEAIGVAEQLGANDFRLSEARATLTSSGREKLGKFSSLMGPDWDNAAMGELAVCRALEAKHLWEAGEHFEIEDGTVVLLDKRLQHLADNGPHSPEDYIRAVLHMEVNRVAAPVYRGTLRGIFSAYRVVGAAVAGLPFHRRELRRVYRLKELRIGSCPRPDVACFDSTDLLIYLNRIRAKNPRPVLLGGNREAATDIARRIRDALGDACDASAFEQGGFEILENCVGWMEHRDDAALISVCSVHSPDTVLVPISIGSCPPPVDFPAGLCFSVALANTAESSARRSFSWRMLFWLAMVGAPGCRMLAWGRVRRAMIANAANEADLRQRLVEFDLACRRAVSFLSQPDETEPNAKTF